MIIGFFSSLGRILGSSMLTITALAGRENINKITFSVSLALFFLCSLLIIISYSELRVKAIARIMRKYSRKGTRPVNQL
jgi:hypothetical protein